MDVLTCIHALNANTCHLDAIWHHVWFWRNTCAWCSIGATAQVTYIVHKSYRHTWHKMDVNIAFQTIILILSLPFFVLARVFRFVRSCTWAIGQSGKCNQCSQWVSDLYRLALGFIMYVGLLRLVNKCNFFPGLLTAMSSSWSPPASTLQTQRRYLLLPISCLVNPQ